MTRYNTGNPVGSHGSTDPRDFFDNMGVTDQKLNSDEDTFVDRLGRVRPTLKAIADPSGLVQQAVDAAAAANTAKEAAFVNADVYDDVAAGLAATSDGEQFQVAEGAEVVRYRNESGSAVEVARYLTSSDVPLLSLSPGFDVVRRMRESRHNFSIVLAQGNPRNRPPIPEEYEGFGSSGLTLLIPAGNRVYLREPVSISGGDRFDVSILSGNILDTDDGDYVSGVVWLNKNRAFSDLGETIANTLPGSELPATFRDKFSFGAPGSGADIVAPSGAMYAMPFFGVDGGSGRFFASEFSVSRYTGINDITLESDDSEKVFRLISGDKKGHVFDFGNSYISRVRKPGEIMPNGIRSATSDAELTYPNGRDPRSFLYRGRLVAYSSDESDSVARYAASRPLIFSPPCTIIFSHVSLSDAPSMSIFQNDSGEAGRIQMRTNAAGATGTQVGRFNVFINGASGGSGVSGQPAPADHPVGDAGVFSLVLREPGKNSEFWRNGRLIDTFVAPTEIYQGNATHFFSSVNIASAPGQAFGRFISINDALDDHERRLTEQWVGRSMGIDVEYSPSVSRPLGIQATCGIVALLNRDPIRKNGPAALDPLYEKLADVVLWPASMTKVLTAMVMLDYVDDLHDTLEVKDGDQTSGSGNNLQVGDILTYEDSLYNLMLPSSNVTATVVAREVGEKFLSGGAPEFIAEMNKKAAEIGMNDSAFANPHGLHNDDQVTTARDMARMGVAATQYADLMTAWGTASYQINIQGPNARTINISTSVNMVADEDPDILGGKTGTLTGSPQPVRNLIVLNTYPGGNYAISVIIQSPNDAQRYADMRWMIDRVRDEFFWPLSGVSG